MKYKYPFIRPNFPAVELVAKDYERIIDSNWFTNFGPIENELCEKASNFLGESVFVTTIANATLALQAAIDILFIPKQHRNQVIVPSFTFAAAPEMLIKSGLSPVYIDIDDKDWQPSFDAARNYIQSNEDRVCGILLSNTFGIGNKNIAEWEALAKQYRIPLIIDSAAGFGSLYSCEEMVGLRGDCEIFSMHATKPFSVGEGGLVSSKNSDFIKQIRSYQNFGFDSDKKIVQIGTNAKLQELNCAIGIRQLEGLNERLELRRKYLKQYKKALEPLGFYFAPNSELSSVCFASTTAPSKNIAVKIRSNLAGSGVEARQYYTPLHSQEILARRSIIPDALINTDDIYERILCLPVYDRMAEEDITYIANSIKEGFESDAA